MKRKFFAAALLISSLVMTLAASPQGRTASDDKSVSSSEVVRKNLAPVSRDVLHVQLPKPMETTLSNGLTVIIIEDHRAPLVSVQYSIGAAGPLYEPADVPGLAYLTAATLRLGTKTRNSLQIAEEAAKLGASVNASSAFGSSVTTVGASGLSDNFDQWFALANDILLNPSFPAAEVNQLKDRLRIQLRQQRGVPAFLLAERFNRAVYGNHPGGTIAPTMASIDAMTPERLAKWHDDRYAPQNTILGISGDVHPAQLVPQLEKWLAGWKKTDLKEVLPPNAKPATARKVYLVDRPGSVQTNLAMGNIAIDRRDPDYLTMIVLDHVLGGGAAARLFLNLREEKGYTYGAYSTFTALKYPGPWRAFADVRTDVTDGAMTEFVKEIRRIGDQPVGDKELDEAKRAIVASFALGLESPETALNYAIISKIYGYPADFWDTYPAHIAAITAADVQRVAKKYYNPDAMQIVAVGDASKIKSIMQKYGPVEVYDIDGKKIGN